MVGSWKHIGNSRENISIPGVDEDFMARYDKQFRSASMKAGRVRTTMEEECREILHSVEQALAQEMRPEMREERQEMRVAAGRTPPDAARIAACLHLQRAVLRAVRMQPEPAAAEKMARDGEWRASHPNAGLTDGRRLRARFN
jgi:hypothetical protein